MEMYGLECPCRECQERYVGCGAKCDVYKLWKKEYDAKRDEIREKKYKESWLTNYQLDQKMKSRRRHCGKNTGKRRK